MAALILAACAASAAAPARDEQAIFSTAARLAEASERWAPVRLRELSFERPACAPEGGWLVTVEASTFQTRSCFVREVDGACLPDPSRDQLCVLPPAVASRGGIDTCSVCGAVAETLRGSVEPGVTRAQVRWPVGRDPDVASIRIEVTSGAASRSWELIGRNLFENPDGAVGRTVSARLDESGALRVWETSQEGQGNNASGSDTFTGIWTDGEPEQLPNGLSLHRVSGTLPMGEAVWTRAVRDEGFRTGFSHHVLCGDLVPGGVRLYEACVADPDPRAWGGPSYPTRCEQARAGCPRGARPDRDPRAGTYRVVDGRLTRVGGGRVE